MAADGSKPPQGSVASDVATLTTKLKVHISKPLLAAAGWPTGEGPTDLIAEVLDSGRIRLHLEKSIQPSLDAKRAELAQSDSADEYIATFNDRYRKASLYRSSTGHDVQFTLIVASHLRVSLEGDRQVYLEAKPSVIDIMSPEFRSKRIRDLRDDTSI